MTTKMYCYKPSCSSSAMDERGLCEYHATGHVKWIEVKRG